MGMRIEGVTKEFTDEYLKIEINFNKNTKINAGTIKLRAENVLVKHGFQNIQLDIKYRIGIVIFIFTYNYWGSVYRTELDHDMWDAICE